MKLPFFAFFAAALLAGGSATAADNEAGVPLSPAEAAGVWTLATNGQTLCLLTLRRDHGARALGSCGPALSAPPTGWTPAPDGMRLLGSDRTTLLNFHRWSNSLFIAHAPGGDLQLRRGR